MEQIFSMTIQARKRSITQILQFDSLILAGKGLVDEDESIICF